MPSHGGGRATVMELSPAPAPGDRGVCLHWGLDARWHIPSAYQDYYTTLCGWGRDDQGLEEEEDVVVEGQKGLGWACGPHTHFCAV